MQEVLVVSTSEEDEEEDTRAQRTLSNLKRFNLKTAIYSLDKAWRQLAPSVLANAWNPLLKGQGEIFDVFEGFESDVREMTVALEDVGEATEVDVHDWLTVDETDPGYAVQSTQEIAASVLAAAEDSEDDDEVDEGVPLPVVPLKALREYIEGLLLYIDQRPNDLTCSQQLYPLLRESLSNVIEKQHSRPKQTSIASFFQPVSRASSVASSVASSSGLPTPLVSPEPRSISPIPSTSGVSTSVLATSPEGDEEH